MGGCDMPSESTSTKVHEHQDDITKLYLWVLHAISLEPKCCKKIVCLTADTFADEKDIHEECGLALIANATLFGMSNTARQEIEPVMHYIDTEWALASENI